MRADRNDIRALFNTMRLPRPGGLFNDHQPLTEDQIERITAAIDSDDMSIKRGFYADLIAFARSEIQQCQDSLIDERAETMSMHAVYWMVAALAAMCINLIFQLVSYQSDPSAQDQRISFTTPMSLVIIAFAATSLFVCLASTAYSHYVKYTTRAFPDEERINQVKRMLSMNHPDLARDPSKPTHAYLNKLDRDLRERRLDMEDYDQLDEIEQAVFDGEMNRCFAGLRENMPDHNVQGQERRGHHIFWQNGRRVCGIWPLVNVPGQRT